MYPFATLPILTVMWLAQASAQLGVLTKIIQSSSNIVMKEAAAVADPVEKAVLGIATSQCELVTKAVRVSYKSYNGSEPDLSKLTLNFITRSINITYQLGTAAALISQSPWFNHTLPLRIYMHGFIDSPTKIGYSTISKSFLDQGDCNIIGLDASSLIRVLYVRSTIMVHFIGEALGEVLAAMYKAGLNPASIHLIGHSLGSHIAGFAGKTFTALTGARVGRITGLDPAGPCFLKLDNDQRLNVNDAAFVDIIHTNAGMFGLDEVIGHVDFYPSSGTQQPNCLLPTCSHSRAWQLFAESVLKGSAFPAVKCSSWDDFREGKCDYNDTSLMGYFCPANTRGKYFLQTSDREPFGKGVEGLMFVDNEGIARKIVDKLL